MDRALDEELAVKEEEFLRQVDTEIELDSGLEGFDQQEGVEDARGVATAPAGHPDSTGVVNTTSGRYHP